MSPRTSTDQDDRDRSGGYASLDQDGVRPTAPAAAACRWRIGRCSPTPCPGFATAGSAARRVCANRETQVLESRLHRHVPTGLAVSYHEDAMPRGAAGAVRDAADASDADLFVVADGTAIPNVDLTILARGPPGPGRGRHRRVTRRGPSRRQGGFPGAERHLRIRPAGSGARSRARLLRHQGKPDSAAAPGGRARVRLHRRAPEPARARRRELSGGQRVDGRAPGRRREPCPRATSCQAAASFIATRRSPGLRRWSDPSWLGPAPRIGSGAVIVGPTSIGREAVIGADVLLSRSAVWRRSVLHDRAVADRCILADDSVISAGTHVFGEVRVARGVQRARVAHESVVDIPRAALARTAAQVEPRGSQSRGVVALPRSPMRIWPVILDSQPSYIRGRGRSASLLLSPLGTEVVLVEHLVAALARITDCPPVVVASEVADPRYADWVHALCPSAQVVDTPQALADAFAGHELSDALLFVDPRCLPTGGLAFADLLRHHLAEPQRCPSPRRLRARNRRHERDACRSTAAARSAGFIATTSSPHGRSSPASTASVVPCACGVASGGDLPRSLDELRHLLISRGVPSRDVPIDGGALDLGEERRDSRRQRAADRWKRPPPFAGGDLGRRRSLSGAATRCIRRPA